MNVNGTSSSAVGTEPLGLGMRGDEALPALARARVVGLARLGAAQRVADRVVERLAARPGRVLDDHAGGDAVEAGVLHEHRRDVVAVVGDLARGPRPGDDDDRRDVAELRGDRLGAQRRPARLRSPASASSPNTIAS
jgi:hypothetical protein